MGWPLVLATTLALAAAPAIPLNGCSKCAAVANELERQMHEEWGHLQLTVRDRKRKLASDAVREQACGEAIQKILHGICDTVKGYAIGHDRDGTEYFQKVQHAEEGMVVIRGNMVLGGGDHGLSLYCEHLIQQHEDTLAAIMANGTDDLITDLCIKTAAECTQAAVARIPSEGLPLWGAHKSESPTARR